MTLQQLLAWFLYWKTEALPVDSAADYVALLKEFDTWDIEDLKRKLQEDYPNEF